MGNQLVFVQNNQVVTDSLTVADVFDKSHDKVIRDIEVQIAKLHEAGEHEFSTANFGESSYTTDRGRQYRKINLTEDAFTLVAMSYVTPEAMKMKVKFIQEFKRMRDKLNGARPLTEREQLMASMKLSLETAEEITQVKTEVKEIRGMVENQITLDHGEQRRVQRAVAHKVYELENDPDARSPLFRELYREIKDRFAIASYKDIKRKDMQAALRYIEAWIPKRVS
ncbi:Rha family transcriptional regulator [Mycobacteroides abscessus]|uniref:Rha family transcriptional regulator n=1 Tax=Mycobacteroides abscessus TaxID=36809 RepID=UPI000C26A0ED